MIIPVKPRYLTQFLQTHQQILPTIGLFNLTYRHQFHIPEESKPEIDKITKIINAHPYPDLPLHPILHQNIPPTIVSNTFVENVLGRLFAAHTNGLKAYEFLKFSLKFPNVSLTSDAFEKTLHILARMRYFDKAWELMEEISKTNPSLLTLKSMSIMLCRIAKYQSYEETLAAFERMESSIFTGRRFGSDEFGALLLAFCTQRQMKEAKSVLNKMYSRFSPDTRIMNILLLGFKETGDITSVDLFYHELRRRGFKPNAITYNIRIDAYCKKGCLSDGLRLFKEMECENCTPTLETLTTLVHGAGIARNSARVRDFFDEIRARNLKPDIGAYNALMSALIRCKELQSAINLMDEMEEKKIGVDGMTYHILFSGLTRGNDHEGVSKLYKRMVEDNFVPNARTGVMLMKFFCQKRRLDLGLDLWEYLVERGFCPHDHALALLATGLCSQGRVIEAFGCSKQMLERGRHISEPIFRMLERSLKEAGEEAKLNTLDEMIKSLCRFYPPSRGHAAGSATTSISTSQD